MFIFRFRTSRFCSIQVKFFVCRHVTRGGHVVLQNNRTFFTQKDQLPLRISSVHVFTMYSIGNFQNRCCTQAHDSSLATSKSLIIALLPLMQTRGKGGRGGGGDIFFAPFPLRHNKSQICLIHGTVTDPEGAIEIVRIKRVMLLKPKTHFLLI